MIAFASLLFAQAVIIGPALPITPITLESPEVLAGRLATIQVTAGMKEGGGFYCQLSATSGMGWVDERLCLVATHCSVRSVGNPGKLSSCTARGQKRIVKYYRKALRGEA